MEENKIKLTDLFKQIEQTMIESGYSQSAINNYHWVWKQLKEFSKNKYYDSKISTDFLSKKFQNDPLNKTEKISKKQMFYLRAIKVLADYKNFGKFFRRKKTKKEIIWPEKFREPIEAYINQMILNDKTSRYIYRNKRNFKDLILYLDKISVKSFNEIKPEYLSAYISSLVGYAPGTIAHKISIYRCLFKYLYINEYIVYPLAESLPKAPRYLRKTLPTIWSKEDIEKVIKVIDRGNPTGKRNYAIILLIANLGLRVGDVRNLELTDIKWKKNQINIIQNKTKNPISLPLLEDVGWGIIDYLKNGRPITQTKNVFVRHNAPFLPFSKNNNLHNIISKYIAKAGIPVEKKSKIGMHSFRHSLATELMQNKVELSTISEILGHSSVETTRQYLKVNLTTLRQCALNVDVTIDEKE